MQFEKGKDLGQLLAEVVGAIRALVVAKLDPDAGREGFPEALWSDLSTAAETLKPERLLAVIDTFSEAESRMKWASNKRLHLEIASLKAIQNLNEIRLSDVISAIGKADPGEKFPWKKLSNYNLGKWYRKKHLNEEIYVFLLRIDVLKTYER